jgi:bacterioferritin
MAKNERLIEALNKDRADELAAILQYMGHHYTAEGIESPSIIEIFKKTAIDEMKHAEKLAERIVYLGGEPVQKASPTIKKGGDLKKMVQDDLDAENMAIKNYKEHIKLAEELGDYGTKHLLEEILEDEEGHADEWETILSVKK